MHIQILPNKSQWHSITISKKISLCVNNKFSLFSTHHNPFWRPFEPSSEVIMHLLEWAQVKCTDPSNTPTCAVWLLCNTTKVMYLPSCIPTIQQCFYIMTPQNDPNIHLTMQHAKQIPFELLCHIEISETWYHSKIKPKIHLIYPTCRENNNGKCIICLIYEWYTMKNVVCSRFIPSLCFELLSNSQQFCCRLKKPLWFPLLMLGWNSAHRPFNCWRHIPSGDTSHSHWLPIHPNNPKLHHFKEDIHKSAN